MTAKNKITIYGPKDDGTYVVEFRTADGEALAVSVPRGETAVLKHFHTHMPYGLVVPEVQGGSRPVDRTADWSRLMCPVDVEWRPRWSRSLLSSRGER
jgi:hypothetical protein